MDRFAEHTDGGGEANPHLDIDLCGLGGGGTFTPMDPEAAKCTGGQTWAAWWHAGGTIFVSGEASRSCTLSIVRTGTVLAGTFGCQGLANPADGPALDLVDGSFQCMEQRQCHRRFELVPALPTETPSRGRPKNST